MQLTKKQRNAMLEAITRSNLNVNDFTLNTYNIKRDDDFIPGPGEYRGVRIDHAPTSSFMMMEIVDEYYSIWAKIGDDPGREHRPRTWSAALTRIGQWAADIKEYADTPDLWVELGRGRELLSQGGHEAIANTPFTTAECAEIAAQLSEIKNYLRKNLSLSNDQLSEIEFRLDEAETAATRINRKDWLLMFLGILFTLIITGLLTPEVVQHIFGMTLHGLGHLFGVGERPIGPPSLSMPGTFGLVRIHGSRAIRC